MGAENRFKIGQKVMITKPTREEDRFRVGTIVNCSFNCCDVRFDKEEELQVWHKSRLTLLPEAIQGLTLEEAEKAVKAARKAVNTIISIAEALKDNTEAMSKASEAFKKEADKDKEIAELKQQVEDLKKELAERPIVVLPKEAVVNIRVGNAMKEYEPLMPKSNR